MLFGSRARDRAKPDSDYDIAVFIEGEGTFSEESERLALLSARIFFSTPARVITATPLLPEHMAIARLHA